MLQALSVWRDCEKEIQFYLLTGRNKRHPTNWAFGWVLFVLQSEDRTVFLTRFTPDLLVFRSVGYWFGSSGIRNLACCQIQSVIEATRDIRCIYADPIFGILSSRSVWNLLYCVATLYMNPGHLTRRFCRTNFPLRSKFAVERGVICQIKRGW